jgi:hypothetical protein
MIVKNLNGIEYFACSKCESHVEETAEVCDVCGKILGNYSEENGEDKFIALDFSEGEFNKKSVVVATLKNYKLGNQKFIVSSKSQIAMRVKYFVINGNPNFLEDGLMQDKLIEFDEFEKLTLNDEDYFVEKILM